MGMRDHLTCLLGILLEPYMEGWLVQNWERSTTKLFIVTLLTYMQKIMWNAKADEFQAGIKIARRNINNLRYADKITLMAENKEN